MVLVQKKTLLGFKLHVCVFKYPKLHNFLFVVALLFTIISGGFHALSKIRQSLREKKPPLGKRGGTVEDVSQELDAVKVDLQVSIGADDLCQANMGF